MELTNMNILGQNKDKSLTINLHHVLSTVTMDDPAVFTDFVRNTLGLTTQRTIDVITNVLEPFGDLLEMNDGYIDNFVKDNHSANITRVSAQRILVTNKVTQVLKYMFFELKDR